MNVNNIGQIFNEKIQNINSKIPSNTNVSGKFQEILELTGMKNTTDSSNTSSVKENTSSTEPDINSLLKTMLSTQSLLSSISCSSGNNSLELFPTSTLNNTINTIRQTQILNALKNNTTPKE